jgi:hypothetical protein
MRLKAHTRAFRFATITAAQPVPVADLGNKRLWSTAANAELAKHLTALLHID